MSFWVRWGQGIQDLPQSVLLRSKLIGNVGMIVGIVFASVYLVMARFWYVSGIMFFSLVLQVVDLISNWKLYLFTRRSEVLLGAARKAAVEAMKDG